MAVPEAKQTIVIDGKGLPLGRVASNVAQYLQGKHLANYSPERAGGVKVIVEHASSLKLTGNKGEKTKKSRFTGYPGGLKQVLLGKALHDDPQSLLEESVRRMLPKNRLSRDLLRNLVIRV